MYEGLQLGQLRLELLSLPGDGGQLRVLLLQALLDLLPLVLVDGDVLACKNGELLSKLKRLRNSLKNHCVL